MHGKDIKVSVAMCTYNATPFLRPQIESILAQTRLPDELLICDDASTDGTVELAKEMTAGLKAEVRILQNPKNVGYTKNYERAISETTGDIIFLCDFDDYWLPEKVEKMLIPFSESPDVLLVYCDAELADADLRPTGKFVFSLRKGMQLGVTPTTRQIGRGIGFNGPMIAIHRNLKPFILPHCNQWSTDHWVSFIAYAAGEVRWVDAPLVLYRRHGKNLGGDPDLDGGFWYRWQVAVKRSHPDAYAYRSRRFDHMLRRLRAIKARGLPLYGGNRLDELIQECEACLAFARRREALKCHARPWRVPGALGLLTLGSYHRHAHGGKSFLQDVAIP